MLVCSQPNIKKNPSLWSEPNFHPWPVTMQIKIKQLINRSIKSLSRRGTISNQSSFCIISPAMLQYKEEIYSCHVHYASSLERGKLGSWAAGDGDEGEVGGGGSHEVVGIGVHARRRGGRGAHADGPCGRHRRRHVDATDAGNHQPRLRRCRHWPWSPHPTVYLQDKSGTLRFFHFISTSNPILARRCYMTVPVSEHALAFCDLSYHLSEREEHSSWLPGSGSRRS